MKIAYLCHRIPYPPNKGEKIRTFHQLRSIASQHEVDVFTLADDAADLRYEQDLARHCERLTVARINRHTAKVVALPYLLTATPLTLRYFRSRDLATQFEESVRRHCYDRIFVSCSAMAQYVDFTPAVPVVVDLVDVDSDKWRQYAAMARPPLSWIYRREGERLAEVERQICEQAACVLVTTERERDLLRQITARGNVHVIPNGVDTEYFEPAADRVRRPRPTIVFVGDMGYYPNADAVTYFVHNVFPAVRKEVPETKLFIVGRNPTAAVQRLARTPGVEVTGFVPDVRPYLAMASVAVAPFSIAAGIQNKILEAMSFGLPVVATTRAVQGLSPEVRRGLTVSDEPSGFASAVANLLKCPVAAERIGEDARRLVKAHYCWKRSLSAIEQILKRPSEIATRSTSLQN